MKQAFPRARSLLSQLILALLCTILLAAAPAARASAHLALEKGCMSCHGEPPRGKAPSFANIARGYAKHRGQEDQIKRLALELCRQHMFGGVAAHERMSPAQAEVFVRWLVDGGK